MAMAAASYPVVIEIAAAVHEAGAYFYCDGANLNAIVGKARPDAGLAPYKEVQELRRQTGRGPRIGRADPTTSSW